MKLKVWEMTDGYKLSHPVMYADGTEVVYSNLTPRSNKYYMKDATDFYDGMVVVAGVQGFIQELSESFDDFFCMGIEDVKEQVSEFLLEYTDNADHDMLGRWLALHDLGYLPLKITAIPDGTKVPVQTPILIVENTHSDFFWLTNQLESHISDSLWKVCTNATIAAEYKAIANHYAKKTGVDDFTVSIQLHDFSMRGMSGSEDAGRSGVGHLMSFVGSDNLPAVSYVRQTHEYSSKIAMGVPACYDSETEVLTEQGFVKFTDLKDGVKVAQYTESGVDFVTPTAKYDMPYSGDMIKWSKEGRAYVDMLVTPNHKMVRINKSRGSLELFEAGDTSHKTGNGYSGRFYLPVSGVTSVNGKEKLTPVEQLLIAFQADGALPSRGEEYLNGQFRFSLKKERKVTRLKSILDATSFSYTMSPPDKRGYVSFWINPKSDIGICKNFSWVSLHDKSVNWCEEFINELQYWDGCVKSNCIVYSNTNKNAIDIVQAVCAISGKRGILSSYQDERDDCNRLPVYSLVISDVDRVDGSRVVRETVQYSGRVHCVSVPSKMLIVRRNGVVAVCGNTEHAVASNNILFLEDELTHRYEINDSDTRLKAEKSFLLELITRKFPDGIISYVTDTYDYWSVVTKVLPELKYEILSRPSKGLAPGKLVIRPDSGNPVEVICGIPETKYRRTRDGVAYPLSSWDGAVFKGGDEPIPEYEINGTIEVLWEIFGGTVNEKGYKVLDSHIGLIYGDSITRQRCADIFRILEEKGFASSNVILGVGSFTYQSSTRDTLGFAVKATYTEVDGQPLAIFKAPKGDSTKHSAKGRLVVVREADGNLTTVQNVEDESSIETIHELYFQDGYIEYQQTFDEIRERLASQ